MNAGTAPNTICADSLTMSWPQPVFDLLFLDPPYNLSKNFGKINFKRREIDEYTKYLDNIFGCFDCALKEDASIYICGDWLSSVSIFEAASRRWVCRNRITWEREKGRGAKTNWKNAHEDVWFFTKGRNYKFYVDRVKFRRKVIAPYKQDGKAKDWNEETGFRDTYPPNIWRESVPFWSMPENTNHPTQKPESLLAKIILASSDEGDYILDPMCGVGTTGVVCKKLKRNFMQIDIDHEHCMTALRRLEMAEEDSRISGYSDGVFRRH